MVRLRQLPPRTAGSGGYDSQRQGLLGHIANRRGKIRVFPGTRPDADRTDLCYYTAHFPDGRPGGPSAGEQHTGCLYQQRYE